MFFELYYFADVRTSGRCNSKDRVTIPELYHVGPPGLIRPNHNATATAASCHSVLFVLDQTAYAWLVPSASWGKANLPNA